MTLAPLPACRLPDWYDKATPEDQAALELNCLAVIAESQRNERTLRACLVGWIEKRASRLTRRPVRTVGSFIG